MIPDVQAVFLESPRISKSRFEKYDCSPNCWNRHHAKYRPKPESSPQSGIRFLMVPNATPAKTRRIEVIRVGTMMCFAADRNLYEPRPNFLNPSRCTKNVKTRKARSNHAKSGNANCSRQMNRRIPENMIKTSLTATNIIGITLAEKYTHERFDSYAFLMKD